jgi:hypothetical protein
MVLPIRQCSTPRVCLDSVQNTVRVQQLCTCTRIPPREIGLFWTGSDIICCLNHINSVYCLLTAVKTCNFFAWKIIIKLYQKYVAYGIVAHHNSQWFCLPHLVSVQDSCVVSLGCCSVCPGQLCRDSRVLFCLSRTAVSCYLGAVLSVQDRCAVTLGCWSQGYKAFFLYPYPFP